MDTFKYAIFAFEAAGLPEELRVVGKIQRVFQRLPHGRETLFQPASEMQVAGATIDAFKAKTCGSSYNLALINLHGFPSPEELSFLLSGPVLGDPFTVFLATLRGMQGPIYSLAHNKVDRESEAIGQGKFDGAPSCVDSYNPATVDEAAERIAKLLDVFMEEKEQRTRAKQTGTVLPSSLSPAYEMMRQSTTTFCGRRWSSASRIMRSKK